MGLVIIGQIPKREFFRINPERVVSILKLVQLEDITPSDDYVESPGRAKVTRQRT